MPSPEAMRLSEDAQQVKIAANVLRRRGWPTLAKTLDAAARTIAKGGSE